MTPNPPVRVVVSIASYRRPKLLAELLASLTLAFDQYPFRVIVVDNAPASDADLTMPDAPFDIDYAREPRPGIVAARNAGLARITTSDTHVMFVDDDERVEPDWLLRQVEALHCFAADVVTGPVVSVFPEDAPAWILRGGFLQRPRFPTEVTNRLPGTGSTLMSIASLKTLDEPLFNEAFSMTGGSDTEFFSRLRNAGARIVWCDESIAYEDVPSKRLTFRWIAMRMVRAGNVDGRLRLRTQSRLSLLGRAVVKIAGGTALLLQNFVFGRGFQRETFAHVTHGIGYLRTLLSWNVQEYRR